MRIVVKVGTSTLAHSTGRLNIRHTEDLVKVLSDLKNAGHEVILVSSGAIGMGVGKLSLPSRPGDMATKQACAAVGQCELMYTYDRLFTAYNHNVAQILLTGVDVEHEGRRLNFQNTLTRLLELGALPIINENDTVATDEITSIGDNDTLAAIVTCCIHADLLVLLSDIDGLYTANPHTHPDAKLIPVVERITPEVLELGVPVLGICYGCQLMAWMLGGKVETAPVSEYGKIKLTVLGGSVLRDVPQDSTVWMSHTDYIAQPPAGFTVTGKTADCPCAAMENPERGLYAVQFHPEVTHTTYGKEMLHHFLFDVCGCSGDWQMDNFIEKTVAALRAQIGDKKVILGLSGGVDSSVAAGLLSRAVGKQLTCVFVDQGLMRKDEGDFKTLPTHLTTVPSMPPA